MYLHKNQRGVIPLAVLGLVFLLASLVTVTAVTNNPVKKQITSVFANIILECFPAGTKVTLYDGQKINIENIKPGDRLLSQDEKGNRSVSTVKKLFQLNSLNMGTIKFVDGTSLKVTSPHPLYTHNGWKAIDPEAAALYNPGLTIGKLLMGDFIAKEDGSWSEVDSITVSPGFFKVYNLSVDNNNNYFAEGFLAHNKGGNEPQYDSETHEQVGGRDDDGGDNSGAGGGTTGGSTSGTLGLPESVIVQYNQLLANQTGYNCALGGCAPGVVVSGFYQAPNGLYYPVAASAGGPSASDLSYINGNLANYNSCTSSGSGFDCGDPSGLQSYVNQQAQIAAQQAAEAARIAAENQARQDCSNRGGTYSGGNCEMPAAQQTSPNTLQPVVPANNNASTQVQTGGTSLQPIVPSNGNVSTAPTENRDSFTYSDPVTILQPIVPSNGNATTQAPSNTTTTSPYDPPPVVWYNPLTYFSGPEIPGTNLYYNGVQCGNAGGSVCGSGYCDGNGRCADMSSITTTTLTSSVTEAAGVMGLLTGYNQVRTDTYVVTDANGNWVDTYSQRFLIAANGQTTEDLIWEGVFNSLSYSGPIEQVTSFQSAPEPATPVTPVTSTAEVSPYDPPPIVWYDPSTYFSGPNIPGTDLYYNTVQCGNAGGSVCGSGYCGDDGRCADPSTAVVPSPNDPPSVVWYDPSTYFSGPNIPGTDLYYNTVQCGNAGGSVCGSGYCGDDGRCAEPPASTTSQPQTQTGTTSISMNENLNPAEVTQGPPAPNTLVTTNTTNPVQVPQETANQASNILTVMTAVMQNPFQVIFDNLPGILSAISGNTVILPSTITTTAPTTTLNTSNQLITVNQLTGPTSTNTITTTNTPATQPVVTNSQSSSQTSSLGTVLSNFPVLMQTSQGNGEINSFGGTWQDAGCGPSTSYNIQALFGLNPSIDTVLDNYLWTSALSSADGVLLSLRRNGFPQNTLSYATTNRILNTSSLQNATGIFVWEGSVNSSVDHTAAFDCQNGDCYVIDSNFGDGSPTHCDIDSDSLICGANSYDVGENGGIPSALYPVLPPNQ